MNKVETVGMDVVSELASAIVERQWNRTHHSNEPHTVVEENGDWRYVEEAQDEFNSVLDLIDEILNPEQ